MHVDEDERQEREQHALARIGDIEIVIGLVSGGVGALVGLGFVIAGLTNDNDGMAVFGLAIFLFSGGVAAFLNMVRTDIRTGRYPLRRDESD